jgi:transcriptional antiterminator NusG
VAENSEEIRVGESVRVMAGPFTDFHGMVEEIHPEKGRLDVLINLMGQQQAIVLTLPQVEKVR